MEPGMCIKCKEIKNNINHLIYNHPKDDIKYRELLGINKPFSDHSFSFNICQECYIILTTPKKYVIEHILKNNYIKFINGTFHHNLDDENIINVTMVFKIANGLDNNMMVYEI